jgi:ribose 5-phosphate isomerase A
MSTQDEEKRQAGLAAAARVGPGMALGLGSGSTVYFFLQEVGRRVRQGLDVVGIPTSERTAALAREFGIPLTSFAERQALDLAVDGADEVDPDLNLIKGHGGALLREKIIARAARQLVIVVDSSKLSPALGTKATLPVEVLPFACGLASARLTALGASPVLRQEAGKPFATDNGNWIVDCSFAPLSDPAALEAAINDVPGVMDNGLFTGLADEVIVARNGLIEVLVRKGQTGP